ncbi:protein FAR1-RELATED SEQUENCE 5-like [Gastrolobium bilobum]|uniref:protein FAR1-RELATED SEQUENCE 5-like n=1 Tax=Gastrolobium bilobum TaxID=150636 RepID=UPI002AB2959B|nr:protein FAR1-RELATED SEQUENCE 5-like [Gastrolobium bilobum]
METNVILDNNLVIDSNSLDMPQSFSAEEVIVEPYVGMEFDSLKKVEHFYTLFAKAKGFGIRTRSRCRASLCVSKDKNREVWVIKSFDNNHNHVMASPKSVSYLRCHKKMNGAAKNLVEKFNEEGLPTGKVAAMFSGSDLAFSNRDCWNHLRNLRRKNLDVGDAQAVFNYCKQKQAQNSNFFYAIQCDDDDRMINFFWVDSRSRFAYQQFGDVITFDTTYRTNKYSMPFAPFTGLNHHLQSILFGCALLQDESEKLLYGYLKLGLRQ